VKPSSRGLRRAAWLVVPAVAALAFAGAGVAPTVASASTTRSHAVVVEGASIGAASAAVRRAHGHVDSAIEVVNAVSAHVDDAGYRALTNDSDVRVTPDVDLHATGKTFPIAANTFTTVDSQLTSLALGPKWSLDAGDGVGVALIDTGVNATPDLRGSRLVKGPDFSGEGDGVDRYGHGTFMAGLIAGDGTASSSGGTRHTGVAPGATVVSVKVAGANGSTSLSKLLMGIGWVIAHEDDYDIGVVNLSFGADVNLPYLFNPLSAAVEAAWASGITVVTSSGNEGAGTVTSPGDDPWVVTVGATDSTGTTSTANDKLASFSGRDRFFGYSKPDVVAPGVSDVSLRAVNSAVDVANPSARVGDSYFRGTGTSMSTALVSGAAAVVLADHPQATPDDVKGALIDGGIDIKGSTAPAVSVSGADSATPRSDWWQRFPIAFGGLGRGFMGMPWTASRWTASRWTASRWTASRWTASRWTASRWTDAQWANADWSASRWTASRWTDASWNSMAWG
jgi:serine protease AprX